MSSQNSSSRSVIIFPALALMIVLILAACTLGGGGTPTPISTFTLNPTSTSTSTSTSMSVSPVNTDGAETVFVPGGAYQIGSTASDLAARPPEFPQHQVSLAGFNIYTHEVTNSMYQSCVAAGACLPVAGLRSDLADYSTSSASAESPVVGVDWSMADAYCTWAGGRLPTEAEWEAAARGSQALLYPWGSANASCSYANLLGCGKQDLPMPVGQFANGNSPFKAWDMAGNVWEWVNDWYDANYYAASPSANPFGPWSSDYKVVRGGGWNSASDQVRAAARLGVDPSLSYKDLGFRCVANGFAAEPGIRLPAGMHTHTDGSDRSVDDSSAGSTSTIPGGGSSTIPGGGDTSTTPGGDLAHTWSWGTPAAGCSAGPLGIFSLPAWNNLGGSYSATVDGAPVTCAYDAPTRTLTCHWPLTTPHSGPGGADYYEASLSLHNPDGSLVPGGVFTFPLTPDRFSACTGTSGGPGGSGGSGVLLSAGAYCSPEGAPRLSITTSLAMHVTALSGDVTISDPAAHCTSPAANLLDCPLDASLMGRSINGQVTGTTLDGSLPLLASFASISVPTCSAGSSGGSSSGLSMFTPGFYCDASGLPFFTIDWAPHATVAIRRVMDFGMGGELTTCHLNPDGSLACPLPPAEGDGLVHITAFFENLPTGEPLWVTFTMLPGSCPGSPTAGSGELFGTLVCRPDGLPGLMASLLAEGETPPFSMWTRYAGVDHPCSPSASDPRIANCNLPAPLPSDLQFCTRSAGGSPTCVPNPFYSAPSRCGGSSSTDYWNFSVACPAAGGTESLVVNAGLLGGGVPASITAAAASTSWTGTPLAGLPGFFSFSVPRTFFGGNFDFTASFPDGSHEINSQNLASLVPATCPSGGSGTGPGGSLCADVNSVSGWHNPSNAYDVNNDGCVTPQDVLILINRLNLLGSTSILPLPRPAGSPFFDVNADGGVSPADVLQVITYLNAHPGAACTPTCGPDSPSGGGATWSLEAVCNPGGMGPGMLELRAHFPGDGSTVHAFGQSYTGCAFSANPPGNTLSQFCEPGADFSAPLLFWVQFNDGAIIQHTFTNAAALAAACPTTSQVPAFQAVASCSTTALHSYDVNFTWTPASYQVDAILDSSLNPLPGCSACTAGACRCTGLTPSPGGNIYVNLNHHTGSGEVYYPLTIAPPACTGQETGGWGLAASCDSTYPDQIDLTITYPDSLGLYPAVINDQPGWSCIIPDVTGSTHTINCWLPVYLRGSGPLTWEFIGPAPEHASIFHTFTEFESLVPRSCPDVSHAWQMHSTCQSGTYVFDVNIPDGGALTITQMDGAPANPTQIVGNGTSHLTILVTNPSGLEALSGTYQLPDGSTVLVYINATSGPCGATVTPFPGITPSVTPFPGITPSVTPRPLTCADYTDSTACKYGGCYWWSDNLCRAKPEPPPACSTYSDPTTCGTAGCYWWSDKTCQASPEPPPACSTYNNGLDCGNAGCYWWGASCNTAPDPCHQYDGDPKACVAPACSYDSKNSTCNTP